MANTAGEKELKTSWDEFKNKGKEINMVSVDRTHSFQAKERAGLNE